MNFAEKISVHELAYRSPLGRPGRKLVSSSKVEGAVQVLKEKGYYQIMISSQPLYEHEPVFISRHEEET